MFAIDRKRPFDTIAQAEQAWQAGDLARAEKLFEVGIAAYEREEPDGLDFALGRCGAFLLAQGRRDEAAHVLEQAIEQKTDIPAIWSDYLRIVVDRRDIDSLKGGVERMAASVRYRIEPEFLLVHARRADREGATTFAEQITRWIIERSAREGDKEGRWAAIGDLGRILERAGHLDQAVKLWREAFDEGSCDSDTASRLSMHLERAKNYAGAMLVIREALTRRLSASVEESLRKRLARCEEKTADRGPGKTSKRADVAAYSVRRESALFEPVFQVRLKPSVKGLGVVDNTARCLLASGESSTLVDVELTSGSEVRRIENLPPDDALPGARRRPGDMFRADRPREALTFPRHSRVRPRNKPRQRGRQRGFRVAQYSLGKWITLLAKYSVISSSGKSVCSISLVNTILPLPSSHVSVALRSGRTASFQT